MCRGAGVSYNYVIPALRSYFMLFQKTKLRTALLCLLACSPLAAQEETLDWLSNYREAVEQAKRTRQPIFLEYRCEP